MAVGLPHSSAPGSTGHGAALGASQELLLLGPGAGEGHGQRGERWRCCIPFASPCSSLGFTPCSGQEGGRSLDAPGAAHPAGTRLEDAASPWRDSSQSIPMSRDHPEAGSGLCCPMDHRGAALPLVCPMRDAGSHRSLWELRDPSSHGGSVLTPPPRTFGG